MKKTTVLIPALVILLCLGLFISGSGKDSAQGMLQDYLTRVENATGIDSPPTEQIALQTYPTHRTRTLPIEDIRVGFFSYLKLYNCDLFNLVSERNSVMGRVMPISQKLVYEIKFLQGAEKCYRKLAEQAETYKGFLGDFAETIQIKRQNLPSVFWNATFDSPEMQKAFSLAVQPLHPDEDDTPYTHSRQAIDYFHRVGAQLEHPVFTIDKSELEGQYFSLQLHQYGGRLLTSIAQLTAYLNRIAHSLETAINDRPLCYQQKPNQKARILETIFLKYYAGRVVPYLSQVHQQGQDWLGAINQLIAIQKVQVPQAFADYRAQMLSLDAEGSLWRAFENATHRHTKAWQQLLGQCGLMPGQEKRRMAG